MSVILQHCTVTIVMLIDQSIIFIILILEKAYYGYMKEKHFKKACFRFQPLFALDVGDLWEAEPTQGPTRGKERAFSWGAKQMSTK